MLCYDVIVSTEGPKGTERIIIGVEGVVDICVNVVKIIGKECLVGIIMGINDLYPISLAGINNFGRSRIKCTSMA